MFPRYGIVVLCLDMAQAMLHKKLAMEAQVNAAASAEVQTPSSVLVSDAAQKFLIVSFPQIRQVAYCKLPDNVFYPLVLGDVSQPMSIAVDQQNARLFVADPPNRAIWWYGLKLTGENRISTVGQRQAAVQNVTAHWIAVNSQGDLYFTGTQGRGNGSRISVWRQDAQNIASGSALVATEVYSRDNSGVPDPAAWVPSGIAVDSMHVYWGNEIGGQTHGSVVKATRTNVGLKPTAMSVDVLSQAISDVRGMTATGTHVFYTSPQGIYGVLKTEAPAQQDPHRGLVVPPRANGDTVSWNPTNIAWDGDTTLYFTETSTGTIYSIPALNVQTQALMKHVDAPGAFGIGMIAFSSGSPGLLAWRGWMPFAAVALSACLAAAQS